jgi:hypothetical protein
MSGYKDIVPKRDGWKKIVLGKNYRDLEIGYNQALTDHQPLYDYVEKLEKALESIEITLDQPPDRIKEPIRLASYEEVRNQILDIARKARGDGK